MTTDLGQVFWHSLLSAEKIDLSQHTWLTSMSVNEYWPLAQTNDGHRYLNNYVLKECISTKEQVNFSMISKTLNSKTSMFAPPPIQEQQKFKLAKLPRLIRIVVLPSNMQMKILEKVLKIFQLLSR